MRKQIGKLLLAGLLCSVVIGLSFGEYKDEVTLGDIFRYLAFGEFNIGKGYVFVLIKQYFPYLIFQSMWGTYLYRYFDTVGVYYFSRMNNRREWYWKKAGELFGSVVLFMVAYVTGVIVIVSGTHNILFHNTDIWFLIFYFSTQVIWIYLVTILTNIFSILWGSSRGYMIVTGGVLLCVSYYVILERVFDFSNKENIVIKASMLKINPLSHVVMKWHTSGMKEVDSYMRALDIDFSIWGSICFLVFIAMISTCYGENVVRKQEFIVANRETGGML